MRYAGPWKQRAFDSYSIEDANGQIIVDDFHVPDNDTGEKEQIERLVLAAPELLETVKALLVYHDAVMAHTLGNGPEVDTGPPHNARALIARIEKGSGV
jgi:ribosomal protein S15P/S13E